MNVENVMSILSSLMRDKRGVRRFERRKRAADQQAGGRQILRGEHDHDFRQAGDVRFAVAPTDDADVAVNVVDDADYEPDAARRDADRTDRDVCRDLEIHAPHRSLSGGPARHSIPFRPSTLRDDGRPLPVDDSAWSVRVEVGRGRLEPFTDSRP
jgi:uncharacterized protein (DUF1330 family)